MNQYSCMLALAGFCLTPQNRHTNNSPVTELSAEPAVREFSGRPLFLEPLVDADLLIVNRWDRVKFPASPDFPPRFLLPPMVIAWPVDWDSVSKEPVPWRVPELREPRGDERPVEWPPRREQYREGYVVITDSRVLVERRDGVVWRRHDVPLMSSAQVKFIRGRAVPV